MKESLWAWSAHFSSKEIDSLVETIESTYELTDSVIGEKHGEILSPEYRSSKIAFVHKEYIPEVWKKIEECIYQANKWAYNFDITKAENVQYTVYNSNLKGKYDWHADTFFPGSSLLDRKISVVIQLSDPSEYEGGDLEFDLVNEFDYEYKESLKEKGSVITFPSFFHHRVTEVTKGERKSLVIWVEGPAFR
jgi:PKHD-type hydroxylase